MSTIYECPDNSTIDPGPSGTYTFIQHTGTTGPACNELTHPPGPYELTLTEGAQITAAILLVWTIGYIGRMIIAVVLKSRYG